MYYIQYNWHSSVGRNYHQVKLFLKETDLIPKEIYKDTSAGKILKTAASLMNNRQLSALKELMRYKEDGMINLSGEVV